MRKLFSLTSDEIGERLGKLQPGTQAFSDCIDELKHRSTSKAKRLLQQYSRLASSPPLARTKEERLAAIKKAFDAIERANESVRQTQEALAKRALERPQPSLASTWSYAEYLARKAKEEAEEQERIKANNEKMWTELELQQRRENRILDQLAELPTEALMELWDRQSWIRGAEDEKELDATELRILRALLRARIL